MVVCCRRGKALGSNYELTTARPDNTQTYADLENNTDDVYERPLDLEQELPSVPPRL